MGILHPPQNTPGAADAFGADWWCRRCGMKAGVLAADSDFRCSVVKVKILHDDKTCRLSGIVEVAFVDVLAEGAFVVEI